MFMMICLIFSVISASNEIYCFLMSPSLNFEYLNRVPPVNHNLLAAGLCEFSFNL